jgi:nicotinamide-nucleotide amidase
MPDTTEGELLAAEVGRLLGPRRLRCVTAESCTGGWLAQTLTAIPGSSAWFERGFVTYSNESKRELLEVSADALERYGAVSEQVARAMAEGALRHSQAQLSVAISGIAGPAGASPGKPVGTVVFAWAGAHPTTRSETCHFAGDRAVVRWAAVLHALRVLVTLLQGSRG